MVAVAAAGATGRALDQIYFNNNIHGVRCVVHKRGLQKCAHFFLVTVPLVTKLTTI